MKNLKAVIAGGGNVLKRKNDMIGEENVKSVKGLLKYGCNEYISKPIQKEKLLD